MSGRMTWLAGAAKVRFTPDEAMWLAGYAVRAEPSRGVISDLYASALALEDAAGQRLVIVSADVIAIPRAVADAAAERVARASRLCSHRRDAGATHFVF